MVRRRVTQVGAATSYVVLVAVALAGCGSHTSSPDPGAGPPPTTDHASFQPKKADYIALRALLAKRASAVLRHDEAAFLATVDTHDHGLVSSQRTLFQNMSQLPLTSLAYTIDTGSLMVPTRIPGNDPVLRPSMVEQLQIRGTMPAPVSNAVDETFVRRDGHWLVGAESSPSVGSSGQTSDERPWYGVAIVSRSVGPMTVLVDRSRAEALGSLTQEISSDVDFDASLLHVPAEHAILVDATSNGTSTSFSTLSKEQAGAVTFGLSHTNADGSQYLRSAGLVIKVNPHNVSQTSQSTPLMRHELTHFLLHEYLGSSPRWLSEGVANWVEYYPDDYPSLRLLGGLYGKVMHSDRALPTVGVFNYDPDVHYQVAQAAVAWLISHYGMSKLLTLMRAYRDGYQDANVDALTPRLLRQVYGISQQQVVAGAFGLIRSFQH